MSQPGSAETAASASDPDTAVPTWLPTFLAAVGQAVAIAAVVAIGSSDGVDEDYGAYLFAAGFGALLLVRDDFPVAVLTTTVLAVFVYYSADYPPIGMAVPAVGAFYGAARRGKVVVAVATGVVLLAVSLFFRAHDGESRDVLAYDVLTNAALIGCAVALALTVRSRLDLRAQQDRLVTMERERQTERAERRLEAERLRIARDVHDSVGHALSLVSVQARVAQQALGEDDTTAATALDNVVGAARASLADLRRTLAAVQGGQASDGPAPTTLDGIQRTAQAARDAGLAVTLSIDVDGPGLPASTARTAFRIVQESVTNVLRHARASSVEITLTSDGGVLRLRVLDDGRGAVPGSVRIGRGIEGMRERAALLGGTVTVQAGGPGFAVDAVLPIGGPR